MIKSTSSGIFVFRRLFGGIMSSRSTTSLKKSKQINSAAERNKDPILEILKQYIFAPASPEEPQSIRLLEISSGTGQHVVHFAPHFPWVTFQPSDVDESSLNSISAYIQESGLTNVKTPIYLDVTQPFKMWDGGRITENSQDYIVNINMIHITPLKCTQGLFTNGGSILHSGGILFTYGPYAFNGTITPESNVRFDAMLRQEDPEWGLRDVRDLSALAAECGFQLENTHALPSNNHVLVWRKQ
ncbi:UPF0585 protein CG18661 [Gryllus bimaculatus]|nr:UPF0585 protein CG18661 [Gryllus bimaculatus]